MRVSDQAYNRLKILKAIRGEGPISRTVLAARTGLSGGTITHVTAALLRRGLIIEQRLQPDRPGRPQVQLQINDRGGVVIGASLEPAGLIVSFVDLMGKTTFVRKMKLGIFHSIADGTKAMAESLAQAIEESPFEGQHIRRVAISLQAVVDTLSGDIYWWTTFPPGRHPMGSIISKRLGLPVTIEPDWMSLARAEHWFGHAQSIDTFSIFHVDLAVGGAQYVDGFPQVGGNGFNSEIGHTKTDLTPNARPCFCGGAGCLTAYSSIYGMLQAADMLGEFSLLALDRLSTEFSMGQLRTNFSKLMDKAEGGNRQARALLRVAGEHLGLAVANHINACGPSHVFVLAEEQRILDLLAPSFRTALDRSAFSALVAQTSVELGLATADWRGKGVAALALEQIYLGGGSSVSGWASAEAHPSPRETV